VHEEQYWISAIVAAYGDPLLNAANDDERGFFDALGGSLCVDRSGDKKQSDERHGDTSHAAYDGSGSISVADVRPGQAIPVAIGVDCVFS
jgi:hypothetical protein